MQKEITHLSKANEAILRNHLPNAKICGNLAEFYSIFSDTTRLKIVISLLLTEMCVGDLSTLLNINQTTISHQLKVLKCIGAVDCTRKNKYIFYRVNDKFINAIVINGFDYILKTNIA